MRIPGLKTLKQFSHRISSRFSNHALILGYHRIAQVEHDPFKMCVSPNHFAEQLAVLRQHCQVISLSRLIEGMKTGHFPEQAVALTFDDGYADVLQNASLLLEAYQFPATVFVVSGNAGGQFWWDRLERAFLRSAAQPEPAALSHSATTHKTRQSGQQQERLTPNARTRHPVLVELYRQLKNASPEEREQVIAELEKSAGSGTTRGEAYGRTMSWDELIALTASGLIEIGSHSVSHPWLAELKPESLKDEISQSKFILEKNLGREVTSFSYPNGSVSTEVVTMVKQSGFHCACTSANGVVMKNGDIFQLPRFWISDWDGAAFERWLKMWKS